MADRQDEAPEMLLRAHGGASFGPGFADRVMSRVETEQAGPLVGIAPAEFFRLAAAAVLVVAALAAFNVTGSASDDVLSTLEAVFGLPPITADTVYDPAAIFLADGSATS